MEETLDEKIKRYTKNGKYFSQWGQDQWLNENIIKDKMGGIFVDVGAYDGVDISNSLFLEKELNWTGLCIEPHPRLFNELKSARKAECVNCCAYSTDGFVNYMQIEGYASPLSGIEDSYHPDHVARIKAAIQTKGGVVRKIKIPSYRLQTLFDERDITRVDYLSIDTEGSELEVLQGIDFEKTSVDFIDLEVNYEDEYVLKIKPFLDARGYIHVHTLGGDLLFCHRGVTPWPF